MMDNYSLYYSYKYTNLPPYNTQHMFNTVSQSSRKRQQFHESIRRKAIDAIQKTRRAILIKQQKALQQQKQDIQLYNNIIQNPQQIHMHGVKYLQMFKQVLQSQYCSRYKSQLPNILNIILQYYSNQAEQIDQHCRVLLIQCIGLIYYEIIIPFYQMTKQVIKIAYKELMRTYGGGVQQENLRVRCLIVIENVSSCECPQVLQAVVDERVLQKLEQLLEQMPVSNRQKQHIMGIYGNLLDYCLKATSRMPCPSYHSRQPNEIYCYSAIFNSCINENYHLQVVEKGVQTLILLYGKGINDGQLMQMTENLLFVLLKMEGYISRTQKLVHAICTYLLNLFQDAHRIQKQTDYSSIVLRVNQLLQWMTKSQSPTTQGKQQLNNINYIEDVESLIDCHTLMYHILPICHLYHEEQGVQNKKIQLITHIMDFWVEMEDDCSDQAEQKMLEFIVAWSMEPGVIRHLVRVYQECNGKIQEENTGKMYYHYGSQENHDLNQFYNGFITNTKNTHKKQAHHHNNSLTAPTWQITIEFLKFCTLESASKMHAFCTILSNPLFIECLIPSYRGQLLQKIEGCFYSSQCNERINNGRSFSTIGQLASNAMHLFEYWTNME